MQSIYTATVVNQIVDDRVNAAARSRSLPRRRRRFLRGERAAAPLSPAAARLRVREAGR